MEREEAKERLEVAVTWLCEMLATEDFHALRKMKTAITRNNVDIFEAYRTGPGARGAKSSSKPTGEGKAELQLVRFWARFAVLANVLHKGSEDEVNINQRELYYRVKTTGIFPSIQALADAISKLCVLVGAPKHVLGVVTSPKGTVYGRLVIGGGGGSTTNCLRDGGYVISGDPNVIKSFTFQCSATCILVIEKETVFRKLIELNLIDKVHCILITGRGYPDVATRCFLKHLSDSFGALPVYALVDCNPDGLQILAQYKVGSARARKFGDPFLVRRIAWLGIHPSEAYAARLYTAPNFTQRDRGIMKRLLVDFGPSVAAPAPAPAPAPASSPVTMGGPSPPPAIMVSPEWVREMHVLSAAEHKVDIEKFREDCDLADYISLRILQDKCLH